MLAECPKFRFTWRINQAPALAVINVKCSKFCLIQNKEPKTLR